MPSLSRFRRHHSIRAALLGGALALPHVAAAQTQIASAVLPTIIVVTGTRSDEGQRADTIGASLTVLDPEALTARQTVVVSDILRDVPSLAVSRTGGVGGATQVRLRGSEGNHTLVLIDGMEASDPYQGEFDFGTLIADDVAKIEVLRGEQSALYGSDAIGGVIHYITLSGREAPGLSARIEGGSFASLDSTLRFAGVAGDLDYAISGAYFRTSGTPTARPSVRNTGLVSGKRDIGAEIVNLAGKFAYAPSETFRIKAVARYNRSWAETNDQDFEDTGFPNYLPVDPDTYGFAIDSDDFTRSTSLSGLIRAELSTLDGMWTHALQIQGVRAERRSFTGTPSTLDFADQGGRIKGTYETSFHFGEGAVRHTLTAAADIEREDFRNTSPPSFFTDPRLHTLLNTGIVGEYDLVMDDIGFSAAVRHDINQRFADATTYHVQASYRAADWIRLHAAAGSGFKAPGYFELFGTSATFQGNPDLKPESSRGWEAGGELHLFAGRVVADLTYYRSVLSNEIFTTFNPPFFLAFPTNRVTGSTRHGVELSVAARLDEHWRIDGAYSYLEASENGADEVRRPRHLASVNLAWRAEDDAYGANLTARYTGAQWDNNFTLVYPGSVVRLPAFTLVNVGADVRLTDAIRLYGRVENLLDRRYEEVFTFRAPGRAFYAGIRVNLV